MLYLRQSTAATVTVGPFVGIDGVTPNAGLADQSGNARLATNGTGAAFTASSWTADGTLGHYAVGLSTAHTGTVGRLRLAFSLPATYAPVWEDYEVLAQAVYDVIFGTVAPSTYAGGAVASVANPVTVGTNSDKTGYALATPPPTGAAIAALILASPAHLLTTDASGNVAANNLPGDYQQRGVAVTFPTNPPANYGFGFPVAASPAPSPTAITITVPSDTVVASWVGRSLIHMPTSCEAPIVGTPTLVVDQMAIVLDSGWPTPSAGEMCYPKP